MNVFYINTFVSSTVDVFQKELNVEFKKRSATLAHSTTPSFDTAILFGFTGFVKGQVVFSMNKDTARKITKGYLHINYLEFFETENIIHSTIGELGNMILGNVSIILAGANKVLDLTPPLVMHGENLTADFVKLPTITILLDSKYGTLEIKAAFVEDKKS